MRESTDGLALVVSGRAGDDGGVARFSIVCDGRTRVFEGLGRNRVGRSGFVTVSGESRWGRLAEETQCAQDIRFGNQQQDRVAVEEGRARSNS